MTCSSKAATRPDSFTLEELLASGIQKQYPGCMINSFELAVRRAGFFTLRADIIASGARNNGSASGSHISAEPYLKAGHAAVFRATGTYDASPALGAADVGTPTTISGKVVDLSWRWNNNITPDDLYLLGGGDNRGIAERDRRTQELTMTVEFDDFTYAQALEDQTTYAFEVDIDTGVLAGAVTQNYGAQVVWPQVKLSAAPIQGGLGKLLYRLSFNIQQHTTHGSVILVVWNKQASYLT